LGEHFWFDPSRRKSRRLRGELTGSRVTALHRLDGGDSPHDLLRSQWFPRSPRPGARRFGVYRRRRSSSEKSCILHDVLQTPAEYRRLSGYGRGGPGGVGNPCLERPCPSRRRRSAFRATTARRSRWTHGGAPRSPRGCAGSRPLSRFPFRAPARRLDGRSATNAQLGQGGGRIREVRTV